MPEHKSEIAFWWTDVEEVGNCAFCYGGSKDGRVLVVRGIALEFRICPSCLKQLRMRAGGHTLETCRQRVQGAP